MVLVLEDVDANEVLGPIVPYKKVMVCYEPSCQFLHFLQPNKTPGGPDVLPKKCINCGSAGRMDMIEYERASDLKALSTPEQRKRDYTALKVLKLVAHLFLILRIQGWFVGHTDSCSAHTFLEANLFTIVRWP